MMEKRLISTKSAQTSPGALARHAWKILLGLAVVIGLFGVGDLIFGLEADPAIPVGVAGLTPDEIRQTSEPLARLIDLQVTSGAIQLISISALWGAILALPFRRGERWAWYAMWTFPAWSLSVALIFLSVDLQPDVRPPPPAISGWVFFGLTTLLLLVSRRNFELSRDG